MTSRRQRVRVAAPAGMDRLELVDAVAGDEVLAKAQRKYNTKTFRREPALDQIAARFTTAYDAVLDKIGALGLGERCIEQGIGWLLDHDGDTDQSHAAAPAVVGRSVIRPEHATGRSSEC